MRVLWPTEKNHDCEVPTVDALMSMNRCIPARTVGDTDRADRSIIDHIHIIDALEARDTELVDRLAREHTLNLARHVERHVDYLS